MKNEPSFGRLLGLLVALDAALLFSVLGQAPLSRIDEGQIAEVSREMVAGGDWLTPRIGGVPFPAYPPLAYWLCAASGSAFGFTEFAMRLPTALAALALIAIVAVLARRLAGAEAGLAAAVMLTTTPAFFLQSGVCRADVMTMCFATAAFDRFLAWADGGRRVRDLALLYLLVALGILAKGPLAVAMLGLGGLSWFLIRREWRLLLAMKFWIGIPAVMLIVVPWYYAVYRANGWAFLHENLLLENLNAYTEGYQQKRPWFFYLVQAPLLLPWLLLLPLSGKVRGSRGVAMPAAWFGLVFLFFMASAAKRINYLTYFCPPLAIAAATTAGALWTDAPRFLRRGILGVCGIFVAGALVVAVLPASIWTGSGVRKIAAQVPLIAGAAGAGAVVVAEIAWRKGPRAAGLAVAAVAFLACFVYGSCVNSRVNPENCDVKEFCLRAAAEVPPGQTIAVPAPDGAEGLYHFYVGAVMPLRAGEPGYYLAGQHQHSRFVKDGRNVEILDSMVDHRGRYRYLLRIHP